MATAANDSGEGRAQKRKLEDAGTSGPPSKDAAELDATLAHLMQIWKAPRTGADVSVAKWNPAAHLAEVKVQRGSYLRRMGLMFRGRQYLTLEEALYLVDRGSLLLVADTAEQLDSSLSRQEVYSLMVAEGVPYINFQVYANLMRHGFCVRRHPPVWVYAGESLVTVHASWRASWPDSRAICEHQESLLAPADASDAQSAPRPPAAAPQAAAPPASVRPDAAATVADGVEPAASTGPAGGAACGSGDAPAGGALGRLPAEDSGSVAPDEGPRSGANGQLQPPCQPAPTVDSDSAGAGQRGGGAATSMATGGTSSGDAETRAARLAPLRGLDGAEDLDAGGEAPEFAVRFAVYRSCEPTFTRGNPGEILHCVAVGAAPPVFSPPLREFKACRRQAGGVGVKYAVVTGGDVVFVGEDPADVPMLL